MNQIQEVIKSTIPLPLLTLKRHSKDFLLTRQIYTEENIFFSIAKFIHYLFLPKTTILFYPQRPGLFFYVTYKLSLLLNYAITSSPNSKYDVVFKYQDTTFFDSSHLKRIPLEADKIINGRSYDISKQNVNRVFNKVFGYSLEIDPTLYSGPAVCKANLNAAHNGKIINCPISQGSIEQDCVYQKLIDNITKDNLILDYRVPIHGDRIPFVYLKYRPVETRFANDNLLVDINETDTIFSPFEQRNILSFAKAIGIDYGEFDILRDRDGKIYIVDVNSTPAGPPNGLPQSLYKSTMKRLMESFEELVEKYKLTSNA